MLPVAMAWSSLTKVCSMSCTCVFVDDLMFLHNRANEPQSSTILLHQVAAPTGPHTMLCLVVFIMAKLLSMIESLS